jgi:cell division protein YceG involved in septum cleavage
LGKHINTTTKGLSAEWINRTLNRLKKQPRLFVVVIIFLLLISLVTVTSYAVLNRRADQADTKQFYVGVTYCGSSVEEVIELVEKVKDCTNLFVLQSGTLQWNITAMDEIGDYVISLGLNYAIAV